MKPTMFFEDLPLGKRFETPAELVTEDAILAFARQWDPQPFHIDPEAARASVFGGIIASGFHTVLVAFNLILQNFDWSESSMGSPGMNSVRWLAPVRPVDTLQVKSEVIAAKLSQSKPDRGFVEIRNDIFNQHGEMVAQYTGMHMLRRKA